MCNSFYHRRTPRHNDRVGWECQPTNACIVWRTTRTTYCVVCNGHMEIDCCEQFRAILLKYPPSPHPPLGIVHASHCAIAPRWSDESRDPCKTSLCEWYRCISCLLSAALHSAFNRFRSVDSRTGRAVIVRASEQVRVSKAQTKWGSSPRSGATVGLPRRAEHTVTVGVGRRKNESNGNTARAADDVAISRAGAIARRTSF